MSRRVAFAPAVCHARRAVPPEVVFLYDRFVETGEARVPLTSSGHLLGDGVFTTMRARRGVCFRRGAHLAQLARGAALFGLPLPRSVDELGHLADEAAARTGEQDAYVRVTLTRPAEGGAELSVIARRLAVPSEAERAAGVAVGVVGPRRAPAACADPEVKTTSYAPFVLARREAERRGLAEGLQLALDGTLAGGAMTNLFVVTGDDLLTPPIAMGARAGITRAVVIELAPSHGLAPREAPVRLEDLHEADEVFLTSSRVGCLRVASVDGRPVGRSAARTDALHASLERLVDAAAGKTA